MPDQTNPSADEVLIRVTGVSKSYRIVKNDPSESKDRKAFLKRRKYETYNVFHDINLEVRRGEVIGILGTNGCGKSTFLKMISKILKPDSGRIQTRGKIVGILELSMGFHPDLSGYDNIYLRSELYGIPHTEVDKVIDKIVKYADLGDYIHNPVRTYSSGMRSRLAFSVMINVDADVYLIDEALSTGDAKFASKASEHIKNLVRKGKTIMLVSHSMGTIENTCNRAIWLCDHTIKMDGPAETVCAEYNRSLFDSFEDIQQLAEDGSSSAMYRLACCYRDGDKTGKDPSLYRKWLSDASERGHTIAMAEYADMLMDEDRESNRETAAELYKKAAEKGNYEARRKYSALVSDGYADLPELTGFYRDMAANGDAADLFALGNLLYKTAMCTEQYSEAAGYLTKAAEKGNADAQQLLGMMYREGTGVPRDIGKAVALLKSATDGGNGKAPSILADMYDEGKLVPRDVQMAFSYYLISAERGNAKSQYTAAVMYRDGEGTEKNEDEARKWFGRYIGSLLSDFRLDAAETIKKNRLNCGLSADDLVAKAAECGNFKAQRMIERKKAKKLGSVEVTAENLAEQTALADGGNPHAMYSVAVYYKSSTDAESIDNYRKYMSMAAENGIRDARIVVQRWGSRNKRRSSAQDGKKSTEEKTEYIPETKTETREGDPESGKECYLLAMEWKGREEMGSAKEYRRLMRLAAEKQYPEAVELVQKWDRKNKKRSQ